MNRYTKLNDLKPGSLYNIFGVVRYFRQPQPTRGKDYCMTITVTDPSLKGGKLVCVLFHKDPNKFPQIKEIGDIVRFHRLKVDRHRGTLQGQSTPGLSSLVISGDDVNNPRSPTIGYSYTKEDKDIVENLLKWTKGVESLDPSVSGVHTLSEVNVDDYFDVICQVAGTIVLEEGVSVLFKVWDGTKSKSKVWGIDNYHDDIKWDVNIRQKAGDYITDVCVFENHYEQGLKVKPGDFVKFCNLHAFKHSPKPEEKVDIPVYELCLHRGTAYGRALYILNSEDKQLESLLQRIQNIQPCNPPQPVKGDASKEDDPSTKIDEPKLTPSKNRITKDTVDERGKGCKRSAPKRTNVPSSAVPGPSHVIPLEPIINVAPSINDDSSNGESLDAHPGTAPESSPYYKVIFPVEEFHPEIPVVKILQLKDGSRDLVRVNCNIVKYEPANLGDAAIVYCNDCMFVSEIESTGRDTDTCLSDEQLMSYIKRYDKKELLQVLDDLLLESNAEASNGRLLPTVPDFSKLQSDRWSDDKPLTEMLDIPFYRCPRCQQNEKSDPILQYSFKIMLKLKDDTGEIDVVLWGDSAKNFLQTSPAVFVDEMVSLERVGHIEKCLHAVGSVKFCLLLKSFETSGSKGYELADTNTVINIPKK